MDVILLIYWHNWLSANQAGVGEGFLEVGYLLLQDNVFAGEGGIVLLEASVRFLQFIVVSLKLIDLLLESLLVSLLSMSASNSRFPVLESLSSFLVLNWVF